MSEPDTGLVDFLRLRRRVRTVALFAGGGALAGAVVDALAGGLSPALLARWLLAFGVVTVLGAAVVAALSALGAADRAQHRGQRLSGSDVGLLPRRRQD